MVVGLLIFLWGQRLLGPVAEPPCPARLRKQVAPGISQELLIYLGTGAVVLVAWQLVQHLRAVATLLSGIGVILSSALIYYLVRRCTKVERERLIVAIVLILFRSRGTR